MKRPTVKIKRSDVGAQGETIAEVTFPDGSGCLVSIGHRSGEGRNVIEVYRADPGIVVRGPGGSDV